ncbi:MAG: glycosyltransferase family 2 protein [Sphingomonadaceae bacterium]|nr:glycosyltransferase family 2 protein [Sphingomonadaceae bacterium]
MAVGPRLGVVLVNWRRAADTIECLESLLRSTIDVRVAVVDNASGDGSVEAILGWAAGDVSPPEPTPAMARLTTPPLAKPIAVQHLQPGEAAAATPGTSGLTVIDAGANLGFAGGNNVGLGFLLRDPAIEYVWLLNNDTVVEPEAAAALLARLDATFNVGMCGTIVRYYHRPDTVQALNGHRFSLWLGTSRGIGADGPATQAFDPSRVARETDFVLGASLAVSRRFVAVVGPMTEDYFLYYEEVDWAFRNGGRFATAFANGAIVYHKEGGSIGSSGRRGQRSVLSDYYLARSRLGFIRRRVPLMLPWHWGLTVAAIGRRLVRGQPKKALALTRALLGLRYKPEKRG